MERIDKGPLGSPYEKYKKLVLAIRAHSVTSHLLIKRGKICD